MKALQRLVFGGLLLGGVPGCAGAVPSELLFDLDLDVDLEQQQANENVITDQTRALAAAATAAGKSGAGTSVTPPPGGVAPSVIAATQGCPTGDTRYFASSAASDPAVHNGNDFHSVWAPKFFCNQTARFDFEQGATVDVFAAGGARIQGVAVVSSGACGREGERWQVDVTLPDAPDGSVLPKLELKNPGTNQPPSVTDLWQYFLLDETRATLTQIDGPGVATLSHRPANKKYGFQVGFTANGKNTNFGTSGWFFYSHDPGGGAAVRTGHGDFNLDLDECQDQPPTTSYTGWGLTTCAESAGYRVAYSGVVHVAARRDFTGSKVAWAMSDLVCLPNAVETGSGGNTSVISNHLFMQLDHFRMLSDPSQKYMCVVCVK